MKVYTSTTDNQPAQADVIYAYNPVGAVDTLRYGESGAGFTVELPYQYNVREWLTEIGNVGSAVLPFNAHYSYFGNGNIQKSEYRNTGSPMEQRYKYDYVYDNANRLLSANYQYHSGSWQDPARFDVSGLQYDGNGNILALNRKKEDNSTIDNLTYSYITGTNKLQSVTDAVATTTEDWDAEDTQFAYDGNGNVIEMLENGQPAISGIQYDHRNLPVSLLNRNGDLVTYRYDASGQRIFKKVGSLDGEYYIMDGGQNVAVFDESGSLKYWNLLANGLSGRFKTSGEKQYYLKDHLGSTRAVVNNQGTVVEAHDYYPFGLLMPGRSTTTGEEAKEKFTGKEWDKERSAYHLGARPLMAPFGRFPSPDRFADKYPSLSPYAYAANNPVLFIDVNGDSVRTSSEEDAKKAAELINEKHEGANVNYEKRTKEKLTLVGKLFKLLGRGTEGHTKTETYYVLVPGQNGDYDWGQNEFTSALYDVLVSDEVTFNLTFSTEYKGENLQKYGGGRIDSYAGGGNVFIDPRGKLTYRGRSRFDDSGSQIPYEDAGIVLLHELLGHGHPVGGSDARRVNVNYGSIWIERSHGGYHDVIGWKKTNLFK